MVSSRYRVFDSPIPMAIAHRGGAEESAENTAASIDHALSLGFDFLETDVRATLDRRAVVLHDPDLSRTLGEPIAVADVSYAALVDRLGERAPMLLEDLLADYPSLRVNIDAKEDRVVAPLVKAVRRTGALARVCVASFSDRRVRLMRRVLGPAVASGLGQREVATLLAASRLPDPAARLIAQAVPAPEIARQPAAVAQVPLRYGPIRIVDEQFVAAAHALGLLVHVWTIDEPAEMERLLDLGVDGIMTDRPTVLRDVLRDRGLWRGPGA